MQTGTIVSPQVANRSANSAREFSVVQISFVSEVPPGTTILREFNQPRHALAVKTHVDLSEVSLAHIPRQRHDGCIIVFWEREGSASGHPLIPKCTAEFNNADADAMMVVQHKGDSIRWWPEWAIVQCKPECKREMLAALVEFAFYEGELRVLEAGLKAREPQAERDVSMAYQIDIAHLQERNRIKETIEFFTRMRLTFARLQPRLGKASPNLPSDSRAILTALFKHADVEERALALDGRLEALEDLYEGTNDRLADYRWYHSGTLLELAIVMLLVVETLLIGVDIWVHNR
jgi:hypothetical protein